MTGVEDGGLVREEWIPRGSAHPVGGVQMEKVRCVRCSAGAPAQKYKKTLWKLHAHRLCSLVARHIDLVDARAEVRPPLL